MSQSQSLTPIKGFSKLSKQAKIEWIIENHFNGNAQTLDLITNYWHTNNETQKLHDEFAENTLSNFYMPFGVAPNFLINGKLVTIPMAIEESSVVAAACKAANFWLERGGFKTEIIGTTKVGHVHFVWKGKKSSNLVDLIKENIPLFKQNAHSLMTNMELRGGGLLSLNCIDKSYVEPNYFQLEAKFETCDSMGANFINSCLENFASTLVQLIQQTTVLEPNEKKVQILMSILSNYTPECMVRAYVECNIADINEGSMDNEEFADKFAKALKVAEIEPYRAVTHNKGIMNGTDAVIIATGNDFRATAACAHAYASRNGQYTSLSFASIADGKFKFWLDFPVAIGTVGGITRLHPMVKFAHELLDNPNATELMQIIAVAGLAQNFSALRSLVTSGIQKGHMKMHLLNILNQLEATENEKLELIHYFKDNIVSFSAVVDAFCKLRGITNTNLKTPN